MVKRKANTNNIIQVKANIYYIDKPRLKNAVINIYMQHLPKQNNSTHAVPVQPQ